MKNLMITLGLVLLMSMLLQFQTELNVRIWKNLSLAQTAGATDFPKQEAENSEAER